jgi:hypothetical protein
MADDSNALTHVPQSRLTNEAEYEAMCTAFAETERGRWFLSEYAKRNRNADTTMVMEAIARIEAAVARQVPPDPGPAIAAALTQTMGELRERAGRIAAEGDETLQAVRRNAQKMRDVAWTLREWGTDSELCDELDALTAGIVESSDNAAGPQQRLLALLDEWNRGDAQRIRKAVVEAPAPAPAPPEVAAPIAASEAVPPAAAAPAPEPVLVSDPSPKPEPAPVGPAPVVAARPVASSQTLGAALLAQGIIAQPRGSDALAPLRRMSQAEKVAFFT